MQGQLGAGLCGREVEVSDRLRYGQSGRLEDRHGHSLVGPVLIDAFVDAAERGELTCSGGAFGDWPG